MNICIIKRGNQRYMLRSIITGGMNFQQIAAAVFSLAIMILFCLPLHEFAHGFAAKMLGDDTAERAGRLTLNPLSHIDWFGVLAMAICGIGWAKPVPVDLTRCRKTSMRTANFIVSVAGPLSNLLMAIVFMVIYKLIVVGYIKSASASGDISNVGNVLSVVNAFQQIATINVLLAVFNMLPIPPFDGYHALSSFLPAKWVYWVETNSQRIRLVVSLVLISGILSLPIGMLQIAVFNLLDLATRFIA